MADQSIIVRIGTDITDLTQGLRQSTQSLTEFGSRMVPAWERRSRRDSE
nr:hypothetical protein P5658_09640 [Bacillus subtilis]